MDTIILSATPRTVVGKKVKQLRSAGQLPGVMYGRNQNPTTVSVDAHEFGKVFAATGHNTILQLKIGEEKSVNVLIHDVALDPIKSEPVHADFYLVKMDEVIRTSVPLAFVGESTAVFQQEGSLITNLEEVEVESLPAHLPKQIEVDISVLDDFDKSITVADLKIPAQVTLLTDIEELVAKVEPPRSDEELEALDEDVVENIPTEEGEEASTTEGGAEETDNDKTGE